MGSHLRKQSPSPLNGFQSFLPGDWAYLLR